MLIEKISNLCLECYQNLNKTGKPNDTEWTSLSCLVLEENDETKVICMSTGTKCVPGNQQEKTNILIDSHSEVLCKRAFKRYLMNRIITNNFLVDYRLHLFVSQLPCGVIERYQGQRIKEPNILVKRKPGKGEICLEASCIDKIAKWNIFGLQGRRLIGFINKPIKLDSIIIGNCSEELEFDQDLLTSCLKLDQEKNDINSILKVYFCSSFKLNPFIRLPHLKACPTAIVYWRESNSIEKVEVVVDGHKQGATKKNASTNVLKISRQSLLKNIQDILQLQNKFDVQRTKEYIKVWNDFKINNPRFKGWKSQLQRQT